MKKIRFCFDLDGTLCTIKQPNETYTDVKPIQFMIDIVNMLHNNGHTIIIQTARNMKTQGGNVGAVIQNVGIDTLNWLQKYNVQYNEIYFGKPYAHVYVDDLALNINDLENIVNFNTLDSKEKIEKYFADIINDKIDELEGLKDCRTSLINKNKYIKYKQ